MNATDLSFALIMFALVLIMVSGFGLFLSKIDDTGKPDPKRKWVFRFAVLGATITMLIVVYVLFQSIMMLGNF